MASYDSTTGIHTMTIDEAAGYLRSLPQNTKEAPYKVNITGIDLNNNIYINKLSNLMQKVNGNNDNNKAERYLDLSNTKINVVNTYCLAGLFSVGFYLIVSPTISNDNNITNINCEDIYRSCVNLTTALNLPDGIRDMRRAFGWCESLTAVPNIPAGVKDMNGICTWCTKLTTIPNIPDSVENMSYAFFRCYCLTAVPNIPASIKDMSYAFYGCEKLTTIPNIPASVTNMYGAFAWCTELTTINLMGSAVDYESINMYQCVVNCRKLKEFIFNIEYKEYDDWTLYLLKRIGNNLNIKRYDIDATNLINDHTISLDNATNEIDLFSKSDELLIDHAGNITDQQIDLLLKTKIEFEDKYSLDPREKWLVIWADNPDNVRSNCFVTQQELKELKALLKTKHPDLF